MCIRDRYGDTVILATAVLSSKKTKSDFLPLVIDYRERTYAAGKIPGGFFKREGRPRDSEILTCRLIDRPIRPLIPQHVRQEIQIMVTVLSSDQENDADVPSLIGASTALTLSSVPFDGPLGAVRMGYKDGNFIINPTLNQLEDSELDLVIAGTKDAVTMLEGGGNCVSEEIILEAIGKGEAVIKQVIELQEELRNSFGSIQKQEVSPLPLDVEFRKEVEGHIQPRLNEIYGIHAKVEKNRARLLLLNELKERYPDQESEIDAIFEEMECRFMREMVVNKGLRADGRGPGDIRPITCKVGVLPRTHGSGLFQRGETQALVTTTLGTPADRQIMDELEIEYKKKFMLHYNFPPFATGEVRPSRGPGRREIGHGALAERALIPVLPLEDKFPYTIRIVSDILESNGSSSMASVCGGSLALMDAGVPIRAPVAGIAIGLVLEKDKIVVLTDIMGMEDHYGDMDFKVAGPTEGVTAIQMDIKVKGVSRDILASVMEEAKRCRLFILNKMEETISHPRQEISVYAPKMIRMKIEVEKIREVIGPGGKTIRKITEDTEAEIDVEDDGTITISAPNFSSAEAAKQMIEYLTADAEVGKIYKGRVVSITKFGAFVEILPGKDGLVHISQLDEKRVAKVTDVVKEGDEIYVKCIEIDKQGRINLSRKLALREMKDK